MLSKERIEALCTDGMYAGVNGDQAEWDELRDLAIRALRPEEEALRKDAERYRWLKHYMPDRILGMFNDPRPGLDALIDALLPQSHDAAEGSQGEKK